MQVELTGLLQSASGPYGGRANHEKLVTRKDGKILVMPRKRSCTGAIDHPIFAWARINWILVDYLWKCLPQRIRAVWGKCTYRTTDLATSNLDMFRKINMPRAMLGFPLLELPPDRFESWATYLERPPQYSRHNRRPPQQVWLGGLQKQQPPWRPAPDEPNDPFHGNGPPPPEPFNPLRGNIANPLVDGASCAFAPCPENAAFCYDELTAKFRLPWPAQPGKDFLFWQADTNEETGWRSPVWLTKNEVWSQQIWYRTTPYYRVKATNIQCRSGEWEGMTIPWPRAWCVRLQHISDPGVLLSYAYYWRDTSLACPTDWFKLAKVVHVYGEFPWQPNIHLQVSGTRAGPPPCCPDVYGWIWRTEYPSGIWINSVHPDQWAGLQWFCRHNRLAEFEDFHSAGPAFVNCTDISCHDSGELAGNWHFAVTVKYGSQVVAVSYRKVVTNDNPGIFGLYTKYDPEGKYTWAAWAIRVHDNERDWNDEVPTLAKIAYQELANLAATLLVCAVLGLYIDAWMARVMACCPYDEMAIYKATNQCQGIMRSMSHGTYRCQTVISIGDPRLGHKALAKAAVKIMRGQILPF